MKSFKRYIEEVYKNSSLGDWFHKDSAGGDPGWDRYNTAGEKVGKCGDSDEGDAYAACLSKSKAQKLGKKGIADFVKRKRAAQKKAGDAKKGGESKKGQKPVNVDTKANEDVNEESKNEPVNKKLWSQALAQARKKFDVFPSAYASAWASKWYKERGGKWRKVEEELVIEESEYQGKKVKLNDPFRTPGKKKKFAVYVKNESGTVVIVRFGDPNMEIKRDDPDRRRNFRARHNCADPGPKWKARYWSCYQWRAGAKVDS
jgi:hypothetical protein